MLTPERIETILAALPSRSVGLVGDLFLDRYLMIDDALTEPSIETGLDAYQITEVRSQPGALGTVLNNLVALGVGRVVPVSLIGDDGEGHELRQALGKMRGVDAGNLLIRKNGRTPTYTKPMLCRPGAVPRELNRLDIKNRRKTDPADEAALVEAFRRADASVDAWIVLDQVSEPGCGAITDAVLAALAGLSQKFVLADSRERIGAMGRFCRKPNAREYETAYPNHPLATLEANPPPVERPLFVTQAEAGIALIEPGGRVTRVPAPPVDGPIDVVGAGDSCSAGIACAVVAGASFAEAAAFGNRVASITVRQLGTTGTATPDQVRRGRP